MAQMEYVCKQCQACYFSNVDEPEKCELCGNKFFNSYADEDFYDDDKPRDEEE